MRPAGTSQAHWPAPVCPVLSAASRATLLFRSVFSASSDHRPTASTRRPLSDPARGVTDGVGYEVIIVHNGATIAAFLAELGGNVHILRNRKTSASARACNQGAAAARGRCLVFLAADVLPHPAG
jgi:hypothetical protein